jgi:protein-S-isoprenylcysteine O-methyltransferase Ste14
MAQWIFFLLGTALIVWVSRPSLRQPGSHGFYRFFAWEIILGMAALALPVWFTHPFSWHQIISWLLLLACLVPIIYGVILLRKVGKPTDELEATTHLVTSGIYRFIRHPLYSSLLLLAWGIFFKSPGLLMGCAAAVTTAFLYATARADERECLAKFGSDYGKYMLRSKMFLPGVW